MNNSPSRVALSGIIHAATVVVIVTACGVAAAEYPAKPVRIIVPTIAGAGLDTLTRLVAQKLTEKSGKAFVVDNRAGAGGAIGMELACARRARRLHTGDVYADASGDEHRAGQADLRLCERFCAGGLGEQPPYVLNVHPSVAAKSVAELIALAKARPGAINFGSIGRRRHTAPFRRFVERPVRREIFSRSVQRRCTGRK